MEKIGIYKAKSELQRLQDELERYITRKNNILEIIDRYDPRVKATQLKQITVSSSLDTKMDKLAEYVSKKEEYEEELILLDITIEFYKKEIKSMQEYIEKELNRLSEYNEWEQKIIYMREARNSWLKIACCVPYSERKCKSIYYSYLENIKKL